MDRIDDRAGEPVLKSGKKDKRRRDIFYLPTRQHHTDAAYAAGVLCRALLAAMLTSGICLFIADSVGIVPDLSSAFPIFYSCVIFCVCIAVICRGRKLAPLGALGIIAFPLIRIAAVSFDIGDVFIGAVASVHNSVIDRFGSSGLASVKAFAVSVPQTAQFDTPELYAVGLMLLSLLLSAIFAPIIVGRFSAIALCAFAAEFIVPCSLYNIMKSNWGFAIFVSAAVGIVVLRLHDWAYTVPTKRKRLVAEEGGVSIGEDEFENLTVTVRKKKKKNVKSRAENKKDAANENKDTASPELLTPEEKKRILSERKAKKKAARRAEKLRAKEERERCRREKRDILKKKRDVLKSERPRGRTVSEITALGGAAGLAAAVLSLIVIVLPARFVKKSNSEIPYIDELIENARNYVTAAISSEEVDLNDISISGLNGDDTGPRSTATLYPKYKYVPIATVETPYDTPVYLRAWIGVTYSDDMWYSADEDDAEDFRRQFGDDFTPEIITENFYKSMYPSYVYTLPDSQYVENVRLGFVLERVSVTRKYPSPSQLLYLPSFVRPSVGLMSYNSSSRAFLPYRRYFDGVWTSKYFFENTSFATESFVTTLRYPGVGETYYNTSLEYEKTVELLRTGEPDRLLQASAGEKQAYVDECRARFKSEYGIAEREETLLYRYLFLMTDDERQQLLDTADIEDEYEEYVRDNYLETDDNDNFMIRRYAQEILHDSDVDITTVANENYHPAIMALVNYLNDNFTYSITPPKDDGETVGTGSAEEEGETRPTDDDYRQRSAIVRFLTETKRGYCVQFASSLTLMLRSLGIPARYCEGYIATDFERSQLVGGNISRRYYTNVLDSNAHAWVEVYYKGIGWVQYEATPAYNDGMYNELSTSLPPSGDMITPVDPIVDDTTTDDDEDEEEEDPFARVMRIVLYTMGGIAAAAVISAGVYMLILRHRSREAEKARAALISRGLDVSAPMTPEEERKTAHELCLGIFDVFCSLGLEPKPGELHDEYASRLMSSIGDAADERVDNVIGYMMQEQFGHSLPRGSVAGLAAYFDEMRKTIYEGLSLKDKFTLRYIKRTL